MVFGSRHKLEHRRAVTAFLTFHHYRLEPHDRLEKNRNCLPAAVDRPQEQRARRSLSTAFSTTRRYTVPAGQHRCVTAPLFSLLPLHPWRPRRSSFRPHSRRGRLCGGTAGVSGTSPAFWFGSPSTPPTWSSRRRRSSTSRCTARAPRLGWKSGVSRRSTSHRSSDCATTPSCPSASCHARTSAAPAAPSFAAATSSGGATRGGRRRRYWTSP